MHDTSVYGTGSPCTTRGVLYCSFFLNYFFVYAARLVNFKVFLKEIWGQSNSFVKIIFFIIKQNYINQKFQKHTC